MDILKALKELISKVEEQPEPSMTYKSVDEEERRIIGVVLEPEVEDLHKDIYSAEEIAKACESFNTFCKTLNLQHQVNVSKEGMEVEESFILPVEAMVGDRVVKAGTWVMQSKIHNEAIWESVKKGTFTGYSVGCGGVFEDIE